MMLYMIQFLIALLFVAVPPSSTEILTQPLASSSEMESLENQVSNNVSSLSVWPFHDKNKTESQSCTSFTTCTSCSDESWCHWCDNSQSCHTYGSWHGCISGSSCEAPKPDVDPEKNDTSGCFAHETCSECALASHLCHWCAHDQRCHAIASPYGCVTGVDCYSNDRCMRKEPEPFEHIVFTQIGYLPLMVVLAIGACCCCCTSACFCVAGSLKGAYDDLAFLAGDTTAHHHHHHHDQRQPLLSATAPTEEAATQEASEEAENEPTTTTDEALNETEEGHADGYVQLGTGSEDEDDDEVLASQPRRPRHMQRLYNACTGCYVVTVFFIMSFVVGSIRYFPKRPEYNICNDSVAWKSLIDSLTALKVTADFEILTSVSNPNHFDVALDMGQGSFTHKGAFVGTYDIPPVTVKAMSITDILVVAHLSPDKWDALSLTAEYYRGRLVLNVDAHATIRIPFLADYSFATDLKDIVVHVNEMADRHLCACPSWDDSKNQTTVATLPFLTALS